MAMTKEEATAFLAEKRGKGRPSLEVSAKLVEARTVLGLPAKGGKVTVAKVEVAPTIVLPVTQNVETAPVLTAEVVSAPN